MRILVTGGAGFIGSNLVHYLLETHGDVRITVLDLLTYAGRRANLQRWLSDTRLQFIEGDIRDRAVVQNVVPGHDAIFHLAAETHVDRSIENADDFLTTNILGTCRLLEAAQRYRIPRTIIVGTDEVYGSVEQGQSEEADRLDPSSPYSASKAAADLLALAWFRTYGTPLMVTRCSNNYGPYQMPEKMIPFFVVQALQDRPLPVYGDGLHRRDWLHVRDHCRALEVVLQRGAPGEIYNVGGGQEMANLEVAGRILQLLDKPPSLIEFVADRPGHDRRYAVDSRKLQALGWRPQMQFDTALAETVAWYRQESGWWQAVVHDQPEYRRIMERQYGGAR